jgi:hypothetical protein
MKATSRAQLNSPVANEYLEPDQFKAGWNKPAPRAPGTPVKIRGLNGRPEYAYPEDAVGKPAWDEPNQGRSPYEGQRTVEAIDANGRKVGRLIGPRGEVLSEWPMQSATTDKPPTGAARGAVKYLVRMQDALKNMEAVDEAMAKQGLGGQIQSNLPNLMQSADQQLYNQSLNMFTEARLRKDSGAAVPPSEYAMDRKTYGIQPGDSPAVIAQKRKSRYQTAKALAIEAGPAALKEHFGDEWQAVIDSMGGYGAAPNPAGGGSDIQIISIKEVK